MHNVTEGPQFITQNMDVVYTIVFGNIAQAVLLIGAGNIVRVPLSIMIPSVIVLAALGSCAVSGDQSAPITLFVFAVLGRVMKRYQYPVAPTVVGLLLGRMVESELIRSWLLILSLLQPALMRAVRRRRAAGAAA